MWLCLDISSYSIEGRDPVSHYVQCLNCSFDVEMTLSQVIGFLSQSSHRNDAVSVGLDRRL